MLGRNPVDGRAAGLVALGFAATVAQTVLLREAMAALGGSELAWGGVLGLWLAGMAIGARLGVPGIRVERIAAAAPVLALLLTGGSAVVLRALPRLLAVAPGEAVGSWPSAWVWALAVLPPAVVGGWAFPVLASRWRRRDGAGHAYSLEAAGALGGGLAFTFLLARHGSAWALVMACGAVSVGLLAVRRRLAAAAAAGLVAVVLAAPSAELLATVGWRWSGRVGSLAAWEESRQQRIEVAGGTPVAIYTDGALLATFPDPHRVSPRANLALLLHGDPRRVLAVGALADGSVIPMLAHPLERLDLVEEDPALVSALPSWFGPEFASALSDPRVRVHRTDPLRALASGGPWDVVALFDGDPVSLRRNRTRTVEFFRTCRTRLAEDGIVIVRAGVADTYLGGAGGRLLGAIFASLRAVFPQVRALPGEEVLLVAGGERATIVLDGEVLAERLVARGIDDPACPPALVAALLDVARREPLETALAAMPAETNRAARPGAVTLAAALHEGRTAPGLQRTLLALGSAPHWVLVVAAGLAAAGLAAAGARRAGPGGEIGVTVGFVSMGLWLLLLWAWQATRGSTYAAVGALSGLFMAGVAAGSAAASRWWRDASLIVALAGLSLTSLLVATSLPTALPGIAVPAALVLAGGLTGVAFPGLARLLGGGDSRSGAGRGFAFDEAGAAASALAVGLGLLPWAGMRTTALVLASLAAAAAVGIALSASRARKCL